eukprot:SAG25_NODE_505_length_7318_cov_6.778917_4_plen_224_part_00
MAAAAAAATAHTRTTGGAELRLPAEGSWAWGGGGVPASAMQLSRNHCSHAAGQGGTMPRQPTIQSCQTPETAVIEVPWGGKPLAVAGKWRARRLNRSRFTHRGGQRVGVPTPGEHQEHRLPALRRLSATVNGQRSTVAAPRGVLCQPSERVSDGACQLSAAGLLTHRLGCQRLVHRARRLDEAGVALVDHDAVAQPVGCARSERLARCSAAPLNFVAARTDVA